MLQVMKPTPTRASPAASISRQPCFIAITTANNTEPSRAAHSGCELPIGNDIHRRK